MKAQNIPDNLKFRQILSPPGTELVLLGLLVGLGNGFLQFLIAPERATSVGLAWFIGTSIGAWVGINVTVLAISNLSKIIRILECRLDDLDRRRRLFEERIGKLTGEKLEKQEKPRSLKFRVESNLLSASIFTYPFCMALLFPFGFTTLIIYAIGLKLSLSPVLALLFVAFIFALSFGYQLMFLGLLFWRMHRLNRRWDDTATSIDDFMFLDSGHSLNATIQKTGKVISFLTKHSAPV